MTRSLKLLIAVAAVALAPMSALAQGWPAVVVTGAAQMAAQDRLAPAASPTRAPRATRTTLMPASQLRDAPVPELRLSSVSPDEAPEVELRAKAEWNDDQGLRLGSRGVAYKSRF